MDRSTVFETNYLKFLNEVKERGLVDLEDISKLILMLRKYKADCHVVIAGQNGVGKTYVLLMLMKKMLGANFLKNMILAKHSSDDIITFLLNNEKTIMGIDELNRYLSYKSHASSDQQHLISMIEIARSKSIGIIGCVRDARKIDNNYRDGKMSIVIWVCDRFEDGGAYAGVFCANPVIEGLDRFGFSTYLAGSIIDFDQMRTIFERIPSFIGYLKIDDAYKKLSKKEIDNYEKEKDVSMAYAHLDYVSHKFNRRKIDSYEFERNLKQLANLIKKEDLEDAYALLKRKKEVKTNKLMEFMD